MIQSEEIEDIDFKSVQIEVSDVWHRIYSYVKEGDLEKVKEEYESFIKTVNIFEEEILQQIELYLHVITGMCAKYEYIDILEWLNSLSYFEIDSFQLFIVASELGNIKIIEWGIQNEFEYLPQHILHTIQNGQVDILNYLEETLEEEDVTVLYSELFIKNAIIHKQINIMNWYRDRGVPIDTDDYNNDDKKKE